MDRIEPIEPRPTWISPIERERPERGQRERREERAREERERRARAERERRARTERERRWPRERPLAEGESEDDSSGGGRIDVRA